ncbi:hypothetical protein FHS83_003212 [Rhizomicrobium palustre]|uniref:Response regulatory domain-containing protein n=1 Tax=Rhizomicrobium palustre TaxID=189966 RepID=A0A846N1P4_9PROT|nr:hypothetical protein [Rhizomicrobium palustre]NIK89894.1 hypothetical protein [Rhizomicrobium palustre]
MALGVCLITSENKSENAEELRGLFERCGLEVSTPHSPEADDGHIYDAAVCLVIDMPQGGALRTLRLFRAYGITTPALLIVDPGREVDPETLDCGWVMDVIPRGSNPLRVLRWVQSMCAARKLLSSRARQSKETDRAA